MKEDKKRKVPLLLWPFWAVWKILTFILGLLGRVLAFSLGLLLLIAGVILILTVVNFLPGLALTILGALLLVRSIT